MNIYDLHSLAWSQLDARRAQLPHALLISGQRGLGKFELARRFAESLLCEQPTPSATPCGQCSACGWLAQGNHPDFRLLQPEALEAMNRSTANSLLKSLEEPIASTLFILLTSESERLLPTIRSRCQSIRVPQPEKRLAEAWVQQSGVPDAARWLALAGGSPELAVALGGSDEGRLLEAMVTALSCGVKLNPLAAAANVDAIIKAEKRPAP